MLAHTCRRNLVVARNLEHDANPSSGDLVAPYQSVAVNDTPPGAPPRLGGGGDSASGGGGGGSGSFRERMKAILRLFFARCDADRSGAI